MAMEEEQAPQTYTVVVRVEDGIFGLVPVTLLPPDWPRPSAQDVTGRRCFVRMPNIDTNEDTAAFLWKHTNIATEDESVPHIAHHFTPGDVSFTQFVKKEEIYERVAPVARNQSMRRVFKENISNDLHSLGVQQHLLFKTKDVYETAIPNVDYELEFAWVEENDSVWCGMTRTYQKVPVRFLMLEMGTLRWPAADTRMACTLRLRCRLLFRGNPVKDREIDLVKLLVFRTEVLVSVTITDETFRGSLTRALAPAMSAVPASCFRVMFLRPSWVSDVLDAAVDAPLEERPLFTNHDVHVTERRLISSAHEKMSALGHTAYKDFGTLSEACQYLRKSRRLHASLDCIVAYMVAGSMFQLDEDDAEGVNDEDRDIVELVPLLYVHCQDVAALFAHSGASRVSFNAAPAHTLLECLQEHRQLFLDSRSYAVARSVEDLAPVISQVSLMYDLNEHVREMRCTPMKCVVVSLFNVTVDDESITNWKKFKRNFGTDRASASYRLFNCVAEIFEVTVLTPPLSDDNVIRLFQEDRAVALQVPSLPRTLADAQQLKPVEMVTNDETWENAAADYAAHFDIDTRALAVKYTVSSLAEFAPHEPGDPQEWRLVEAGLVPPGTLLASALGVQPTSIVRARAEALDALCELRGESLLDWTARVLNHLSSLGSTTARLDQTPKKALGALYLHLHHVTYLAMRTNYDNAGTRVVCGPPGALPCVVRTPPSVDTTGARAVKDYAHDDAGRVLLAAVIGRWEMVQRMAQTCRAYGASVLEHGTLLQCIEWTRQREMAGLLPREEYDPALSYIRPHVHLAPSRIDLFREDAIQAGRQLFSVQGSFTPGSVLRQWMLGAHPERLVRYRAAVVDWEHATSIWHDDNLSTKAREQALFLKFFSALEVLNADGNVGDTNRATNNADTQYQQRVQTMADLSQIHLHDDIAQCVVDVPNLKTTAEILLTFVTKGTGYALHLLHRLQCPPDRSPYCAVLSYYESVDDDNGPEPTIHRAVFISATLARTSVFYVVAWWLTVYCEPMLRATASAVALPAILRGTAYHSRISLLHAYVAWRTRALLALRGPYDPYACVAAPLDTISSDSPHDRYICAIGRILRGLFRDGNPDGVQNWNDIRANVYEPSNRFNPSGAIDFENVSPILWLHAFTSVYDLQTTVHVTTVSSAAWYAHTLGEPRSTTILELGHGVPHDMCPMMHLELRMGSVARPMLLVPGITSKFCGLHMFLPGEREGGVVFDDNGAPFVLDSHTRDAWHAAVTAASIAWVQDTPDVLDQTYLPRVVDVNNRLEIVYGPRGAEHNWTPTPPTV